MDLRAEHSLQTYKQRLHVIINRRRSLNLNSFVIAERFVQADRVPVWQGRKGFEILGSEPRLELRGGHIRNPNDKTAQHFLRNKSEFRDQLQANYLSVAEGLSFSAQHREPAYQFVARWQKPCVVKPAWGKQGQGVTVGIRDRESLDLAIDEAVAANQGRDDIILELQFHHAEEARFLVVGGRCISVFKRLPPAICGDGQATIETLIAQRNAQKRKNPNECRLPIVLDGSRLRRLAKYGYSLNTVLPSGEWYCIDEKASISTGGDTFECSEYIADDYKVIAEQVAELAAPVAVVGVDIMATDFQQPVRADNYIVLEANSGPAITGHRYPSYGRPVDVVAPIYDYAQHHFHFSPIGSQTIAVAVTIFVPRQDDPSPMWQVVLDLLAEMNIEPEESDAPSRVVITTIEKDLLQLQQRFHQAFSQQQAALIFSQRTP
ncbi:MAG: hypothetical protein LAT77_03220 [Aliidiomarina sp.]|uniref:hypothetical protein n=1 Tax=Aliidiomarina sp. TaxID=1872439 RepID=UPI0025BDAD2F|nr:hypothetical protein [Aliidiomarina sp.]MCH8500906.1 hypothetical protein [Aliidiomarina sp.]